MAALKGKRTEFKKYPEQSAWLEKYVFIQELKCEMLDKLLASDDAADKLLTDMDAQSMGQAVTQIREAKEMALKTITKIYSLEDTMQISSMKSEKFHGYSPVDVINIFDSLFKLCYESAVFKVQQNGKNKIMESIEAIGSYLDRLSGEFHATHSAQSDEQQHRTDLKELEANAGFIKFLVGLFDKNIDSLKKSQDDIREAFQKSKELSWPCPKDRNYEKLDLLEHFSKDLPKADEIKKTTFGEEANKVFGDIWTKCSDFESKVHSILNKLQNHIKMAEKLKLTDIDNYNKVIIRIMALRYLADDTHSNLVEILQSWYDRLGEKLRNQKYPISNALLTQIIVSNGKIILKLFDEDPLKIGNTNLQRIEKRIEEFTKNLLNAIAATDIHAKHDKFDDFYFEADDAQLAFINFHKFVEQKKETYEFQVLNRIV